MSGDGLRGHVVLCGLESLGVRTLEELDRLGERVVVIATASDPRHRAVAARIAARIVEGDPRDPGALADAGIPGARAIVLTSDADVGNIHAALAATALDPSIHVVLRAFDEEFGHRVETLIPGSTALSASAIAAPGFVSAIAGEDEARHIELMDRDLAVRLAGADDPNVLAVLADPATDPVTLFPDPGADLLCLVDASGDPARAAVRRRRRRRPRLVTPRPSAVRRVDRRFWVLALAILVMVGLSALVLRLLTGVDPAEALYQAMRGVMGGADDALLATPELRYFALGLTVIGAVVLAAFYGLIVDVIMRARVASLLGPHATDARDHVIVVGLGSIGYRVATTLADRDVRVVAAESKGDGRFVDAARARDIAVVTTDGRSAETLRALRVDRARALLAATDDDAANLATAFQARAARPDLRIVVRLFDPDLAVRLDRSFGGFESRSVSALAAPAFAAAAVGRSVVATIPVGPQRVLVVARVAIEPGSDAIGSSVGAEAAIAAEVPRGGCRIVAVAHGQRVSWRPGSVVVLDAGDELIVAATRSSLAMLARRAAAPRTVPPVAPRPRAAGAWRLPLVGEVDVDGLRRSAQQLLDRLVPR